MGARCAAGLSAPSGAAWGRIWILVVFVFAGAAICARCVLHLVWALRFLPEGKVRILGMVGLLVGPACLGGVTVALTETTSSWQAIETLDPEPIDLASVDASVVENTPSFVLREARCHRLVRYRKKPAGGKTTHAHRFRSIQGAEGTDPLPPGLWITDDACTSGTLHDWPGMVLGPVDKPILRLDADPPVPVGAREVAPLPVRSQVARNTWVALFFSRIAWVLGTLLVLSQMLGWPKSRAPDALTALTSKAPGTAAGDAPG